MGVAIFVLVVLLTVGGVVWNHASAHRARRGVRFSLPEDPATVARAIAAAYPRDDGALTNVSAVSVTRTRNDAFRTSTRMGDTGEIVVVPAGDGGSAVHAYALDLVGVASRHSGDRGHAGMEQLTNGLFNVFGIAPNASRMRRFQDGLQTTIEAQIHPPHTA